MEAGSRARQFDARLNRGKRRAGLRIGITLIELLVAISIISLLMAILLPAIQGARESGRRTQCRNNLRELGLAALSHESAVGHFPTGGWGGGWVGEPGRGTGRNQPGGWIYCVLPYLSQRDLAETGHGMPPAQRRAALAELVTKSLAVLHCPTRRSGQPYPITLAMAAQPINCDLVSMAARNDYAANAGDQTRCDLAPFKGPPSLAAGDSSTFVWPNVDDHTGVIYLRSETQRGHLVNGSTHTYLIAEKSVDPQHYETGGDHGDDWSMYTGYQNDICRSAGFPPRSDYIAPSTIDFGSAHTNVFHAVFCDGSCRSISYFIEFNVHRMLANRADTLPLNEAKLSWD